MRKLLFVFVFPLLSSCASVHQTEYAYSSSRPYLNPNRFLADYSARLPQELDTAGKKTILVDPKVHAWGAYAEDGQLIRSGIATSGGEVCPPDADESDCKTGVGTYRITSMGDSRCRSKKYPRPHGGGLMPYCMYFNHGQALHGSPDSIVMDANASHGCVRMRIPDAEWMRDHFAQVGTKVIVAPYD